MNQTSNLNFVCYMYKNLCICLGKLSILSILPVILFSSLAPSVGPTLSVDRCADNSELSVTVTWPDLTLAEARGIVTAYTISWAPYVGTAPTQLSSATVNASAPNIYVIRNLNPTMRYYVTALATNSRGDGRLSRPMIAQSKKTCHRFLVFDKIKTLKALMPATQIVDNSLFWGELYMYTHFSPVSIRARLAV